MLPLTMQPSFPCAHGRYSRDHTAVIPVFAGMTAKLFGNDGKLFCNDGKLFENDGKLFGRV